MEHILFLADEWVKSGREGWAIVENLAAEVRRLSALLPAAPVELSDEQWHALSEKARKSMGGSEFPVRDVCQWLMRGREGE